MRKSAVNPMKKSSFQGGAKLFGNALQGIKDNDRRVRKSSVHSQEKDIAMKVSMQKSNMNEEANSLISKEAVPAVTEILPPKPSEAWCKGVSNIRNLLLPPAAASPFSSSESPSCSETSSDNGDEPVISPPIPRCSSLVQTGIDYCEVLSTSPTPSFSSGYVSSPQPPVDGGEEPIIPSPVAKSFSPIEAVTNDKMKCLFMPSVSYNSVYPFHYQTGFHTDEESEPPVNFGEEPSISPPVPRSFLPTESVNDGKVKCLFMSSIPSNRVYPSLDQTQSHGEEEFIITAPKARDSTETITHIVQESSSPDFSENALYCDKENVSLNPKFMEKKKKSKLNNRGPFRLQNASYLKSCGDLKPTFIEKPTGYTFDWCSKKSKFNRNSSRPALKIELSTKSCRSTISPDIEKLFSYNSESFIDSHCHLDLLLEKKKFRGSYDDYMRENRHEFPSSYGGCIAIFCKPFLFKKVYAWKKHLSGANVWASFGCHPKDALYYDDVVERHLLRALDHYKVRALGEIGLDYSDKSMCPTHKQKDVFRRQLQIALGKNLPLVIHCRDAYEDCLSIMKDVLPANYPIHLHCFTSEWQIADEYLKNFSNMCIGITNLVTFSSATEVHEVARKIPLNRLLLETDAPFFVPTALSKEATIAHPGMAIFVAEKIASLKSVQLGEVLHQTRINTQRIYKV